METGNIEVKQDGKNIIYICKKYGIPIYVDDIRNVASIVYDDTICCETLQQLFDSTYSDISSRCQIDKDCLNVICSLNHLDETSKENMSEEEKKAYMEIKNKTNELILKNK